MRQHRGIIAAKNGIVAASQPLAGAAELVEYRKWIG